MVDNDLLQETCTEGKRTDAEVGGKRLPQIGKRTSRPQIDACAHARARQKDWDVLA